MFVNHSSAAEIGTTRASFNRTGKTNATENNYNKYSEFHARETEARICASFMEMTGMQTISAKKLKQSIHFSIHYILPKSHSFHSPTTPLLHTRHDKYCHLHFTLK